MTWMRSTGSVPWLISSSVIWGGVVQMKCPKCGYEWNPERKIIPCEHIEGLLKRYSDSDRLLLREAAKRCIGDAELNYASLLIKLAPYSMEAVRSGLKVFVEKNYVGKSVSYVVGIVRNTQEALPELKRREMLTRGGVPPNIHR